MYEEAKRLLVEKARNIVGEGFDIRVDDHDEGDSFGPFSLFVVMTKPIRTEIKSFSFIVNSDKYTYYLDQNLNVELFIDGTTFMYASVYIVGKTEHDFSSLGHENSFSEQEVILTENTLRELHKWPTREEMFKHLKNVTKKTIRNILKCVPESY